MASPLQSTSLAVPPLDVQFAHQDSRSYDYGYSDMCVGYDNVSQTGSMEELEYPPYQSLNHFEEELANNYLAFQLRYPSAYADEVPYAAEPPAMYLETSISDATLVYPSSSTSDATDYSDAMYGQCYSSQVEHPTHDLGQQHSGFFGLPTSYADSDASLASQYESTPSGSTPISTYSTIMNALGPCDPTPSTTQTEVAPTVDISSTHTTPSALDNSSLADQLSPPKFSGKRKSTRTRHRAPSPYTPPPSPMSPSSPTPSSSSSSSPSPSPFSRGKSPPKLVSSTRRNAPLSRFAVIPTPAPRSNKWKCPYCTYIQSNRRTPDLKRHIRTHTRGEDEVLWVCCGVPLIDAQEHGVPAAVVAKEPFEYEGMFMVGGCKKVFSRRDALKRHLRANGGVCFGDAMASYQPGNRMGER